MSTNFSSPKILWAVDAFHEKMKDQLRVSSAISHLFAGQDYTVEPVSVLAVGRYNPAEKIFMESWDELSQAANENIGKLTKGIELKGLLRPKLVQQKGGSISHCVDAFLNYALNEGCDYIAVSSHARKGAARFLLGSFAETLVLKSPIPVLVVNPKTQETTKLKNILFPTDFSDKSKEAFHHVVKIAKNLNCKILLLHKVQYVYPEFGYPFVVPPVSKTSIKDLAKAYLKNAESWVSEAKASGVTAKAHISTKSDYAVDEINHAAKKLGTSGVIAMASQSGKVSSVLLGSLTRQVLRNATCPVLVVHPNQASLMRQAVEQLKHSALELGQHPVMS